MERIFGGSPAAVLLRLVVVSIIVGIVLKAFGVRPRDLLERFDELLYSLRYLGVDAVQWFLLGAMIVIPAWLIYRLLKVIGGKDGK